MTFSVTILGSGSAMPIANRHLSAQILNVNEHLFLIDCGEGTQLQLRKYHIKFQRINNIFISHLHGDHYFGLICLLTTMHLLGRTNELHLYAFPELKQIIDIQLKASNTKLSYPLIFHLLKCDISEIIFEDDRLFVETIILNHGIPDCGFLFREKKHERNMKKNVLNKLNIPFTEFGKIKKGEDYTDDNGRLYKNADITIEPPKPRSYAYCSDTKYFEPVVEQIKDVDLLYHEATFMEEKKTVAAQRFHSTAKQAGKIAKKANVRKLIIGHFSARYKDLNLLLEEAKKVFSNTFLAEDGKIFDI
jgi:ribonuclease Z